MSPIKSMNPRTTLLLVLSLPKPDTETNNGQTVRQNTQDRDKHMDRCVNSPQLTVVEMNVDVLAVCSATEHSNSLV